MFIFSPITLFTGLPTVQRAMALIEYPWYLKEIKSGVALTTDMVLSYRGSVQGLQSVLVRVV